MTPFTPLPTVALRKALLLSIAFERTVVVDRSIELLPSFERIERSYRLVRRTVADRRNRKDRFEAVRC